MSRTTDSRVGRAALRADGAIKADAAATTVRGFAGTCAVAIGPGNAALLTNTAPIEQFTGTVAAPIARSALPASLRIGAVIIR